MMTDYIKRAEALKDFEACNAENPRWTPQRVKTLLLRQPAADVVEVVYGQWIPTEYPFMNECEDCSSCGYRTLYGNGYDYCPNCGAKMDGGSNGE